MTQQPRPARGARSRGLLAALALLAVFSVLVPGTAAALTAGTERVDIVVEGGVGETTLDHVVLERRQIPQLGFERLTVPAPAAAGVLRALTARGLDAWADPVVTAARIPDDPAYPQQWAQQQIRAEAAWSRTVGDRGTVIAVIDTGVDRDHPDLTGGLLDGWDFVDDDPDPDDEDPSGHGTSITGIIAARTDNGIGVAGTCWRCRVMPLRALGAEGVGASSDVAAAIVHAADNGADVINLSLTSRGTDRLLEAAVEYAHQRGVVVVAAAGNDGTTRATYPAAYDTVIAVGASTADDERAPFSNHGAWVSVAAPACATTTRTGPGGATYGDICGSSASAPLVAGLAGLVRSARADLSVEEVRRTIEEGAVPVGSWVRHGRIDAANTVPVTAAPGNLYRAIDPTRILDTRTPMGGYHGAIGHRDTMQLQVAGMGGLPDRGIAAVTLNVTVTHPSSESYLTVWPTGSRRPVASNLNFVPGQTVPNLVTVGVGSDGGVNIYNHSGRTHVVADVVGYHVEAGGGAMYAAVTPTRLLDTRAAGSTGAIDASRTRTLQVAGRGDVPRHGATAVALNVTAVDATRDSYLTVFPAGASRPNTSTINFGRGDVVANMTVAKLGVDGRIQLHNFAGSVHVAVDVMGYFTLNETAASFVPVSPRRAVDTRNGTGGPRRPLGHRSTRQLQLAGTGGVPLSAEAIVVNTTGVEPTATATYLSLYPASAQRPKVSNLNLRAGQVVANLATATIGVAGAVEVYNHSGSTDLVVDVAGYYVRR